MPIKGQWYLIKPNAKQLWDNIEKSVWNMSGMTPMQGNIARYAGEHEKGYSNMNDGKGNTFFFPNFCIDWGEVEEDKQDKILRYPCHI